MCILHSHPEEKVKIKGVLKKDDDENIGAKEKGNNKLMEKVT
jgi:hypothetical protein